MASYRYKWLDSAWGYPKYVRVSDEEENQMRELIRSGCRLRSLELYELAKKRISEQPSRPDYTTYIDR